MPHYFILEAPVASPAKCGLCGYSGADRKYLDPRLDFEFYGSLIFCESCVGTMANDFEFLQPAQSRSLENRLEEAERELVTLRAAIIHLENAHDALDSVHTLFNNGVSPGIAKYDESISVEVAGSVVSSGPVDTVDEGPGDSKIDESSSVERSDDISDIIASADNLLSI